MSAIRLTENEIQYISLFEAITQVEAIDCINDEENDRLIFVVKRGMAGKAIGSKGSNARLLRKLFGRDVEIVEKGETLEEMLSAALFPAKILSIDIKEGSNGSRVAVVQVPESQKGIAIGKNGRNVKRAKLLVKRYFGVDVVVK